jgi:hypothetical protein
VIASRAGIRRRGESTLRSTGSKPNLSIETWGEIDEQTSRIEPFGMPAESDWILYAPWTIDTAMIRNPFIYEVSNEAGRYAVRTRYVEVFLNTGGGSISDNDYFGVYVFMERIKRDAGRVDVVKLRLAPLRSRRSAAATSGKRTSSIRTTRSSPPPARI